MEKKTAKKDNFILQAGILAAAGIVTRIIGLLYRSPLTAIIGDEGNGYYTAAYNIYTIILLIASYSIPSAISKVISQKLALKEYKNAHRMFHCALIYVCIVGGIGSLICFFFAGNLTKGAEAAAVLRVFSPTIFLSGILGVLRGYFQAHKSMAQTSVSQVLEQILNACVSIGAAVLLINAFLGSMQVYPDAVSAEEIAWNTKHAVYGAMGSALGTGVGVVVALLFVYWAYHINKKTIYRQIERDKTVEIDSYKEIFILLLSVVTPFILSTAIYNSTNSINQSIFIKIMTELKGLTNADAYTAFGIYGGKAVVISNIPIALASAMSSAVIPGLSAHFAKGEIEATKDQVALSTKVTMLIAIPSAVGLSVLAKPVTRVLFPQASSLDTASALLCALSVSVIFYSLSTLSNAILQGIGKVNTPVINAAIALILQTAVLTILLLVTDIDLYALVIANVVYSGCMCLLNQAGMHRYLKYKQEVKRTFLLPLLSAAIMGGIAWGAYNALYLVLPINIVCLCVALFLAVLTYFVLVIKTGAVGEEELKSIPKGTAILRLAKKIHLIRK